MDKQLRNRHKITWTFIDVELRAFAVVCPYQTPRIQGPPGQPDRVRPGLTYVNGQIKAKDDKVVLYSPRSEMPFSIVCYLCEVHHDEVNLI